MSTDTPLPPLQRDALLAALATPNHTLRRTRRGYIALDADVRKSGAATAHVFTGRLMNMLWRAALVDFDPPDYPSTVTLTTRGKAIAQQLRDASQAKAGAA